MPNDRHHRVASTSFQIQGMDCADEVALLKESLKNISGISDISFELLNGRMSVEYSTESTSEQDIIAAVAKTGMTATTTLSSCAANGATPLRDTPNRRRTILTVLSAVSLLSGTLVHITFHGWRVALWGGENAAVPLGSRLFYLVAVGLAAWHLLPKAWLAFRRLRPDMNLLMVVAIVGALAIGEFLEAATVALLFAVSLSLESWSIGRARQAIAALVNLSPPTALVKKDDGTEVSLPLEAVPVGSVVIVKPGDRIPLDGRVTRGESTVNQAPITGESIAVVKSPADEVFAGTINQDGALEITTTKPFKDTTLSRIVKLVGDAQSQRSPSEQWVEQFARYYTPTVLILALLVMIVPPLFDEGGWSKWFYEGLVLLVVSCPCALVISTPVSIVAAITSAARNGVLIKGGPFIEAPARLRAIAMDKTGTLTEGRPQVRQVITLLADYTESRVLEVAASLETRSTHPLAVAITTEAARRGISTRVAENFQAIPGKGVVATIDGQGVWLGSHRYLEERGQDSADMHRQLEKLASQGLTVVVVGEKDQVCGFITLADQIRPNAATSISAFRQAGIKHVVMLTGDNRATGDSVAKQVCVDEVRADMLPEDKLAVIAELVGRYHSVAMVGDGVNDAPALARATIGIAMGAIGTDAALETADIVLMSDDLSKLAWLIRHSRRTMKIIHQNIGLSLAAKAIFVILTLTGFASLWAAIMADTGTSLLVIFNGLRLLAIDRGTSERTSIVSG